ncbi:MAG: LacI family transcriptional regulator [Candidatus Omnitrophica bacterium]|nr:LacI family transcriptional regulator [Candidatus Omnitrophota bacterium]MCM8807123.1 LacI family transcriptional regulator [Candidatus Omnitrophota bacterium]
MDKISYLIKKEIDIKKQKPIYVQIADTIREKIKKGELKEGDEFAPEYEFAEALGVSIGTLKKALAILVKEGLIYRRPKLGTFVGRKIKKNILKTTKNILFILSNHRIPDHHYSVLFSGIEDGCRENLYNLKFLTYYDDKNYLKKVIEEGVDGIIIAGRVKKDLVQLIINTKIPFIVIGDLVEKWKTFIYYPRIEIPIKKMIYEATKYLYDNGHKKIVFITGNINFPYYKKMVDGYKKFVEEKNLDSLFYHLESDVDREKEGYFLTEKALKEKPDAILCGNDLMALGCIEKLKEEGFKVGSDISVMGFGNLSISSFISPPLTTVDFETFLLGKESINFLKKIIVGERKRKFIWNKFKIIERESVKKLIS